MPLCQSVGLESSDAEPRGDAPGAATSALTLESILERSGTRQLATAAEHGQPHIPSRRAGKRRVTNLSVAREPAQHTLAPAPPSHGTKARVDFVFENPLDGSFKKHVGIVMLLSAYARQVVARPTSYCHFGRDYRKRTLLVTSLVDFHPTEACPTTPCRWARRRAPHPVHLVDHGAEGRNSLPPLLVDAVLDAWVTTHRDWASQFLLIDLFAGWGSMKKRASEKWPSVFVYANDIVDRAGVDMTLDLSQDTATRVLWLMRFAAIRFWPEESASECNVLHFFAERRVAVLCHASTPCNTYSTEAVVVHRTPDNCPRTRQALRDDEMNTNLIRFFERVALARAT
jgi:hypothetical protein